jgi:flavin-dependent dehydrogenase
LAEKAGAEVRPETTGMAAENTWGGVRVRVRAKSGEETLEARAAVAADGLESIIVESLGVNPLRQSLGSVQFAFVHYVMEGIETGLPESSWLTWSIPSINPYSFPGIGAACINMWAENRSALGTLATGKLSAESILDKFIKHPKWSGMFRHARTVKKEAMGLSGTMLGPVKEPVVGNVVIVGDAGAPIESWIQGSIACGYMAARAVKRELDGQEGYPNYAAWWRKAFYFNNPRYLGMVGQGFRPLARLCTDEEMDFIYELFRGRLGIPEMMVQRNLELIRAMRPELYAKLARLKPQ